MKRFLSLFLVLSMMLTIVLSLTACKDETPDENPPDNTGGEQPPINQDGTVTYTVEVKTVGGMKLEGVLCYVHSGDDYNIVGRPKETDKNGIATFNLKQGSDYSVELIDVPEGYNVKAGDTKADRYAFGATGVSITLSSAPIKGGDFSSDYKVGDVMHDFTVEDINGNTYTLSEMLTTGGKDLVMLNFWYDGCTYCYQEFPYLNNAFVEYMDNVQVLAINDYADNTLKDVENFVVYNKNNELVDMKIPYVRVEPSSNGLMRKRFEPNDSTLGYPFSVFIDRYGVICLIENGASPNMSTKLFTNAFKHFTSGSYSQRLIDSLDSLVVPDLPDIDQPTSEEIYNAFVQEGKEIAVNFKGPDGSDAEYNWPFVSDTYLGASVVHPSNKDKDNSYSILNAEVTLKQNEAVVFDYFSSTQSGYDMFYVLVDGKDIYSFSGVEDKTWKTCCAYVAPFDGTYTISFVYSKDPADYSGDDTVYLKDLRIVGSDEVPVDSLIFRYAATTLSETGDSYQNYITPVYNENDGYYHVNSENGPLLLANLLNYSLFDSDFTVSERLYAADEFIVDGVDVFDRWIQYGNCASNSSLPGFCTVNQELKEQLIAYTETYRHQVGMAKDDNLWLTLCVYYDAYGPTAKQLDDPIKGLIDFSAFDTVLDDPNTEEREMNTVSYDRPIVPRGFLYKFVPTVSGVYRVTSSSLVDNKEGLYIPGAEVNGWIFTGNMDEWVENGTRTIYTHGDMGERFCPNLIYTNEKGQSVVDYSNISMVAYMEAGTPYYIDIAYYDIYGTGSFDFYIEYVNESFDYFVHCSPGPFTFEMENGQFGSTITGGIDAALGEDGYYHHLKEDGTLGSILYADFYYPTNIFPSQSIEELIRINAFNFTITETDREAIVILSNAEKNAIKRLKSAWGIEAIGEAAWRTYAMEGVLNGVFSEDEEVLAKQNEYLALIDEKWEGLKLDEALEGTFDEAIKAEQQAALAEIEALQMEVLKEAWGTSFEENWENYQMDDIIAGIYHATKEDMMTDRDRRAEQYLQIIEQDGVDALFALWASHEVFGGEEFNQETYDYLYYEYFEMDDVAQGIYHGDITDYTAIMKEYQAKMLNEEGYPERQGCVAVDEQLAKILQIIVDKNVFENVNLAWTKFCFYYMELGAN